MEERIAELEKRVIELENWKANLDTILANYFPHLPIASTEDIQDAVESQRE